jgi:2,4-dienoyl-CoA reductase-like NADH-dependent reductase (Old Yellow Enzyme family)
MTGSTVPHRASQPLSLRDLVLRNRIVGTAHGRGMLRDGLALPDDAEYWRRVAAGGAAMVTVGGTVTAPESTWRSRIVTEAWRVEAIPGMAQRAEAIRSEGAVAACQLVHLGRETTGAEMWFAPVAPSAIRSPREPTRPRALTDAEIDDVVEGFRVSAVNAAQAGFQVVELHAAHGYLLAQFLSAATNDRGDVTTTSDRARIVARIIGAIRESVPELIVGIRLSADGELEDVLSVVSPLTDYVNLTVGVRTTYVRDMATTKPPLLRSRGATADLAGISPAGGDRGRARRRGGPRRRGPAPDRRPRIPGQDPGGTCGGGAAVRLLQRGLPCVRSRPALLGQSRSRSRGRRAAPGGTAGRATQRRISRAPGGDHRRRPGGPRVRDVDHRRPAGGPLRRARADRRPPAGCRASAESLRLERAAGVLRARAP